MALRGARLVAVVEAAEGRRLDENLVKQLTGRDTITGRRLYQDETSFIPEHKLILASNYLPEIRGSDAAIWARVLLVRFDVVIPVEERDTTLKDRLVAPNELSGILNWALAGCHSWMRVTAGSRLRPPDSVRVATVIYKEQEDILAPFLADRCVLATDAWVSSKDLRTAYREWCESTGGEELKMNGFNRRLRNVGCKPQQDPTDRGRARGWQGLRLRKPGEYGGEFGTPGTVVDSDSEELPF
jgi:putative DNA primase/helicase